MTAMQSRVRPGRTHIRALAELAARAVRFVLIFCLLLVTACDPDLFSGIGGDINPLACGGDSWDGTWQGTAVSDTQNPGGVIDLSLKSVDDCGALVGAAAFATCVPVTEIRGQGALLNFEIVTIDGALHVETEFLPDIDIDTLLGDPESGSQPARERDPVGTIEEGTYTFTNVHNIPNCPLTDSGTVVLEKTS